MVGGSNLGGANFLHSSRPALEPTHPPVQWVQFLSTGGNAAGSWC